MKYLMMNSLIYPRKELIQELFAFLENDFRFKLISDKSDNSGIYLVYMNEKSRVRIYFDFKEYRFDIVIIRGIETQYPNDCDFENIRFSTELVEKYQLPITLDELKVQKGTAYKEALHKNAELLKEYGSEILNGNDWFS